MSTTTMQSQSTATSAVAPLQPTSWGILSHSNSNSNLAGGAGGNDSGLLVKQEGTAAPAPTWTAPLYASANGNNFVAGDTVDLNEIFAGTYLSVVVGGMGVEGWREGGRERGGVVLPWLQCRHADAS